MSEKAPETTVSVEERFNALAAQWKADRGPTSFVAEMAMHPAYQQIIGLGPAAVPLLLQGLQRSPDHWFWALKAITGADPVPPEDRGRINRMAQHWIVWGRRHGYIDTSVVPAKMVGKLPED